MAASLVVINPRASRARAAGTLAALGGSLEDVLRQRDGAAPRLVETASADEVGPLVAQAVAAGVAAVVGVGGDGTLRDIATVLAGTNVPLGIVPTGTGNQVAAELGIPRAPVDALAALRHAVTRSIDLGQVDVTDPQGQTRSSSFVIGCGAGFDAQLMATTPEGLKRRLGTAAYFLQAAGLARQLVAVPCRITIDGRLIETEASTVLIGNMGQLVPGRLGLRLPLDPADGRLDLIVVRSDGIIDGLRGLRDQLRRTRLGGEAGDRSIRLRGREVRLEPVSPLPLQVDGDFVGHGSLAARVHPAALQVLVPGD